MKHIKYPLFLLLLLFVFNSSKTFAQVAEHPPLFAGGHSQSLAVCENALTTSLDTLLAVIDSDAGDTETWSVITNAAQGSLIAPYTTISTGDTLTPAGLTYTPNPGYSGLDSFTVSVSDGFEADTTTVYVAVNPLPVAGAIAGIAGVCIGDTTILSDTPTGGVWSSSSTGIATADPASGLVTGLSGGACTIYYAVTNGCGTTIATTPFTVNTAMPPMPSVITGLHLVCVGSAITLHNSATGGQWSSSDPANASVDTSLGLVTGISAGPATITYAETNFCASYYSTVGVTVDPLPAAISGPANLCTGMPVPLNDSLAGGMWSSSASGIATVGSITGIVTGLTAGTATITYSEGGASCKTTAAFTVNVSPTAYTLSGGGPYCSGGPGADIGLGSSDTGVSYQLYMGATPVGVPVAGSGAALGLGLQTIAGAYTVVGTNSVTGCDENMSGAITISINPLPTAYTVSGGGSYCTGGAGFPIFLVGSQSGVSYQLYNGVSVSGASVPGTGGVLDFGTLTASGIYTVSATNTTTGCSRTMPGSATITLNTSPAPFAVIGGGNFCAGDPGVHIGLDSSAIGVNYLLYNGGSPYGLPVAGTGIPLDLGIIGAAGVYTVVATNASTGCSDAMPGSTTVVVNPLPAAYTVAGGGGYCIGGAGLPVSLSSSLTDFSYQLYLSGAATGSTHLGTDTTINFGLQTVAGIYSVIATNTATGCTGDMSGSVFITIDSLPSAYTLTGGGSYCAGGDGVYIELDGSDPGTNYQLYMDTSAMGFPETGSGGPLDLGLVTLPGAYAVKATNTLTGCSDIMAGSPTVSVNPVPGAIAGPDSVYVGAAITLTDATAGGAWSSNNTSIATAGATGVVYGTAPGWDTITYTLSTGCIATMQVTVSFSPLDTNSTTVGVAQIPGQTSAITIFPNPTTGSLNIKWGNQLTGTADVVVTDAVGRRVYNATINMDTVSGQTQIGLELKDGVYFMAIKSANGYYAGKLLIQR